MGSNRVKVNNRLEVAKKEYIRGHILIALKHSKEEALQEFYRRERLIAEQNFQKIVNKNAISTKDK